MKTENEIKLEAIILKNNYTGLSDKLTKELNSPDILSLPIDTLDSLDKMELLLEIEKAFNIEIKIEQLETIKFFRDILAIL